MIEHIPTLLKITAVAVGSGWSIFAQMANSGDAQNVHVYGGWGLAVVGLFTLWRELKDERLKRDSMIQDHHDKGDMREAFYAKKYEQRDKEFVAAINRNAEATELLEKSHKITCYAHQLKKPDLEL